MKNLVKWSFALMLLGMIATACNTESSEDAKEQTKEKMEQAEQKMEKTAEKA